MRVSIVTVGDELLAGDIENTNATWLAAQLTDRGVTVAEIVVIPDEIDRIAATVADHREPFDRVVVTGGLGGTPDDVTVEGVAAALDREVVRHDRTHELLEGTVTAIREEYPDFEFDLDRAARRPVGCEAIENAEGIAPGFVCDAVVVIPGVPAEMKATFERIAAEFAGERHAKTLFSAETESDLIAVLDEVRERFDVAVGCYPEGDMRIKRITVRATDQGSVVEAYGWLAERPSIERERPD